MTELEIPQNFRAVKLPVTVIDPDGGHTHYDCKLIISRNTIPGEAAWRATAFYQGKPIMHWDEENPHAFFKRNNLNHMAHVLVDEVANEWTYQKADIDDFTYRLRKPIVVENQIIETLLDGQDMFVSAVLTPESQTLLLKRVPPIHEKVYAHHVTMAYKPDPVTLEYYRQFEGKPLRIPVVATAQDDKAQAVLVGAESENDYPHITISTADGVAPAYSNTLLKTVDINHVPIFTVEAIVTIEPLDM